MLNFDSTPLHFSGCCRSYRSRQELWWRAGCKRSAISEFIKRRAEISLFFLLFVSGAHADIIEKQQLVIPPIVQMLPAPSSGVLEAETFY